MHFLQRSALIGFFALLLISLIACGSTTSYSSSSATPASSTDQHKGDYYSSGKSTPTAAATTGASSTSVLKTLSATVSGKTEMILTNAQGLTLYYFKPDTATTTACSGGCASTWPPLLAADTGHLTAPAGITGKITAVSAGNGQQIQYNGHFLYAYAGDTASGQTNGQGIGGQWFVATPTLS